MRKRSGNRTSADWPLEPKVCRKCGHSYGTEPRMQKYFVSCGDETHRACQREHMKNYCRKNPEKAKTIRNRAMTKKPEHYECVKRLYASRVIDKIVHTVIGHYSDGAFRCSCCGESERDFMTIDHVNREGNKNRFKVLGYYGGEYRFFR